MKRNILVIGGGAIGGITAARLTQKNIDVDLLVKYPELKKLAKTRGLKVTGHHGNYIRRVNAYLPSDLLSETFDIVLIATKANDMREAAMHILPFLEEDSMVVSMQNGICEDELACIVGIHRTVGCIVGWGATMIEPGTYDMTSGGINIVGSLNGISEDRITKLKEILNHLAPTYISHNIYGDLYSKLIINSCISALGAISGLRLGRMLRIKKLRKMFYQIMEEAVKVANAMNITIEPYANKINYYQFVEPGTIGSIKRSLIIGLMGFKFRRLKSSSLQSIERGKKTEIDYFNGFIARQAARHNIDVSLNQKVIEMVKEIERGERKPGLHNFDEEFFAKY
ncbi:MAG: ketopantoate reductase family protein [Bacteroidota bacterium]